MPLNPFWFIIITIIHIILHLIIIIIQADGGQDRELQRRLCSAGQVFRSLEANLFSSRRVGLGAKLKFYKSLVLPRLMYGAAIWASTVAQMAPPRLSCWPALARPTWLTI